jgi:hypothetical protein
MEERFCSRFRYNVDARTRCRLAPQDETAADRRADREYMPSSLAGKLVSSRRRKRRQTVEYE